MLALCVLPLPQLHADFVPMNAFTTRHCALSLFAAGFMALASVPVRAEDSSVTLTLAPRPLDRPATMDDAVRDERGVRRMAVLGGMEKITGRTSEMNAPVGVAIRYSKLTIVPQMCYTRAPEETPETSVFLDIYEDVPGTNEEGEIDPDAPMQTRRIFSGWMFASSPALNALEHPVLDVWVLSCQIDDPNAVVAAEPEVELPEIIPQPKPPSNDDGGAGPAQD